MTLTDWRGAADVPVSYLSSLFGGTGARPAWASLAVSFLQPCNPFDMNDHEPDRDDLRLQESAATDVLMGTGAVLGGTGALVGGVGAFMSGLASLRSSRAADVLLDDCYSPGFEAHGDSYYGGFGIYDWEGDFD